MKPKGRDGSAGINKPRGDLDGLVESPQLRLEAFGPMALFWYLIGIGDEAVVAHVFYVDRRARPKVYAQDGWIALGKSRVCPLLPPLTCSWWSQPRSEIRQVSSRA